MFLGVMSAAIDQLRYTKMIANGLGNVWGVSSENLKHKKKQIELEFEQ